MKLVSGMRGGLGARLAAPSCPVKLGHQRRGLTQARAAAEEEFKLVGPQPERFKVADGQLNNIATAAAPFAARAGYGAFALGYSSSVSFGGGDASAYALRLGSVEVKETSTVSNLKRPAQPIEIYEFEACPFCRKVREAVAILDLDVMMRPCPRDGPTFRPAAIAKGGKAQFPFMVDPNTGAQMYESDDIIRYLFETYGPGGDQVPLGLRLGPVTTVTCALANAPRAGRGAKVVAGARPPAKPVTLWGYEASPFVKVVREALCEMEIPYLLRSCARGSPKRQELFAKRGTFQVPYLEDPNTGLAMFESSAIVDYLQKTYGPA